MSHRCEMKGEGKVADAIPWVVLYILLLLLFVFSFMVSESDNIQLMMGNMGCIVIWCSMIRASARAQWRAAFEIKNIYLHRKNWSFTKAYNDYTLIII